MVTRYVGILLVLWPSITLAQAPEEECVDRPTVTFDHTAAPEILSASLELSDKEKFLIRVVNTAPGDFTYTVTGATAVPQQPNAALVRNVVTTYEECVTHSKQYGGYVMRVERNAAAGAAEPRSPELKNKLFIVSVETDDWHYEVSGGFSLTGHRDKIFALSPVAEGQYRVVEDEGSDKKADARPGVASLLTVFHSRRPQVGFSFGLGVNEGAGATYYLGPTWRFGNVAGLTGGIAFGPVTRLPDGVNVDDMVSDVNLLNTRQTRTARAVFVCISYSFLGSLDTLKKPFAGQ